jgi:hypothetical protein
MGTGTGGANTVPSMGVKVKQKTEARGTC